MYGRRSRIPIDEIQPEEETFRCSLGRDHGSLRSSIRAVGLLSPPKVQRLDDRYRLVSGFLRLEACRWEGFRDLDAEVLGEDAPEDLLFVECLHENLFTRGFNWAERAWAIERFLKKWGWSEARIMEKVMPALGLQPARKILEEHLRVASLEMPVKRELLRHGCSLGNALRMAEWSSEDRMAFAALLDRVHLGENLLREILERIHEISLRDRIRPRDLLRSPEVVEILDDERRDRPWRTRALRSYMRRRRYPGLAHMEAAFEKARVGLGLPREISLQPSPFFETKEITVSFRVRTVRDMMRLCTELWEACKSEPALERLFETLDRVP